MEHRMMTVKEAAEYLRLSEQTVQRYVMRREIPFRKVKRVIRFRFEEIEQWVNRGGPSSLNNGNDDHTGDLFDGTTEGNE